MSNITERAGSVDTCSARFVGTDVNKFVAETEILFDDEIYRSMSNSGNHLDERKATDRIATMISEKFLIGDF